MVLLSNGTTTLSAPAITAAGIRYGLLLEVVETNFSQTFQEVLDPGSALYRVHPDVVLLAIDYRGLPLTACLGDKLAASRTVKDALGELLKLQSTIRANCGAITILQTLAQPVLPLFGNYDATLPGSLQGLISEFNHSLLSSISDGCAVLDVATIAATVGTDAWNDLRRWHLAKLPFSLDCLPLYSDHVARVIGALYGKSRKCLVMDLDDTLWGGVVGEEGLANIVLSSGDPTGEAFLDLQRAVLALHSRGIVLAVCSKNDEAIGRAVFREHPEMLLKETHIAAFRANWEDKVSNLQAIADDLNLALDALVFLDNNPAERHLVRQELPAVAVPELPDDPALFARTLLTAGYFESTHFSFEDRNRNEQYKADRLRSSLASCASNLEGYLRSLEMTIDIRRFAPLDRPRIVQLVNKTNQFNLTTKRYTEAQIKSFEDNPDAIALQVRLTDRFGDNGLISVVICLRQGPEWHIDTWLMSCRVLKRRVEHAVLNYLVEQAKLIGISALVGTYVPTERNGLVSDLFEELGFKKVDETKQGGHWRLEIENFKPISVPIEVASVHGQEV
jgi:FkbH-like protein